MTVEKLEVDQAYGQNYDDEIRHYQIICLFEQGTLAAVIDFCRLEFVDAQMTTLETLDSQCKNGGEATYTIQDLANIVCTISDSSPLPKEVVQVFEDAEQQAVRLFEAEYYK